MTVLAASPQLRIDGLVVATYSHGLATVAGLDVVGGVRRNDTARQVAYHPGELEDWDDYPTGKTRSFDLWVAPYDADGGVTYATGPLGHLRENIDALVAKLATRGAPVDVELDVTTPTGTETRSGKAKVVNPVVVAGTRLRRARVDLWFPWPWWNVLPEVLVNGGTPFTGTQAFTVGGGAPVHDITVTTTGNTVVEHVQTGDTLTLSGVTGATVVSCRSKTVTQAGVPAPGLMVPSHGRWLRMLPGSNSITVTGAAAAVSYFAARE